MNLNRIIKESLEDFLSTEVGKKLYDALNNEYSYNDNMDKDAIGRVYWNGKFNEKQKQYLIEHYALFIFDYLFEAYDGEINDDECERLQLLQEKCEEENEKKYCQDNEDIYNPNQYRSDIATQIVYNEYPNEIDRFVRYIKYKIDMEGNSAKYHAPYWLYIRPTTNNGCEYKEDTWCVHFTNADEEILKNNYFYGTDIDTLGLTLGHDRGEYVFAYDAKWITPLKKDSGYGDRGRGFWYGNNIIMFKASGFEFSHSGDLGLYELVLDRNTIHDIVHIVSDENRNYYVMPSTSKTAIFSTDDFAVAVEWVTNNYDQFKKEINHGNFRSKKHQNEQKIFEIINNNTHNIAKWLLEQIALMTDQDYDKTYFVRDFENSIRECGEIIKVKVSFEQSDMINTLNENVLSIHYSTNDNEFLKNACRIAYKFDRRYAAMEQDKINDLTEHVEFDIFEALSNYTNKNTNS